MAAEMTGLTGLAKQRKLALYRNKALLSQRTSGGWDGHWQSISQNLLPRLSRFMSTQRDKGGDRNQSIIDSAGTQALRILAAGMMAGMTSPARPWFRLTLPDAELAEAHDVKVWLAEVSKLILRIFSKSNTYNTLHNIYRELGGFGTGCSVMQNNFERVIHHNPMTIGEYALGINHEGYVDKLSREFELTVEQAMSWFGKDNLSVTARNAYDNGTYDYKVTVIHNIEPNPDRDPNKRDFRNMSFKSCYWDKTSTDPVNLGLLREGGYRYFKALAPRWDVLWGDTYGSSPGMDALGDLLQLQHQQERKARGIDYMSDPPVQVPTSMRNGDADLLPGGVSYYDGNSPHSGIRNAFDVNLRLDMLLEDIRDVRERVNKAFYADLFLMIAQSDKNMTATEVAERHEEKLLMLGPVLERLHNELLAPLIEITFDEALLAGIVPPPPPELNNVDLQVEFVSMLAQAQKAVSVNSTDRLIGHIGVIVQGSGDPSAWDKFNKDKSIERYADQLGVDPDLIVADDQVAIVRSQRAQAQAAAAQAESMKTMSETGRNMAQIPTGSMPSDNAATDMLNLFSGYNSPSATEIR